MQKQCIEECATIFKAPRNPGQQTRHGPLILQHELGHWLFLPRVCGVGRLVSMLPWEQWVPAPHLQKPSHVFTPGYVSIFPGVQARSEFYNVSFHSKTSPPRRTILQAGSRVAEPRSSDLFSTVKRPGACQEKQCGSWVFVGVKQPWTTLKPRLRSSRGLWALLLFSQGGGWVPLAPLPCRLSSFSLSQHFLQFL